MTRPVDAAGRRPRVFTIPAGTPFLDRLAGAFLSGALFGFALPVANVIAHSDTLIDLAAWGAIAGVIQILAYLVARYTVPHLAEDIPAGKVAPAIFVATLSLTVGLTNAACMTY